MPTDLICGISGQDGAYLAEFLLKKGYKVHGTSRDVAIQRFSGLQRLGIHDQVDVHSMALTDFRSTLQVLTKVQPNEIYNLAGQSSVGLSFEQPVETLESIAVGTLNLLEAIRFLKLPIRFYNAASSECFGDTGGQSANESSPFRPRSPYAVAKSTAFWEVANYRDAYGLHACSGLLFNHESPLRQERFVTAKIVAAACRIAAGSTENLRLGNLNVARDWGWAPEFVEAMWLMLRAPEPEDYVIATGKTSSLETFVDLTFSAVGLDWHDHVVSDPRLFRPSDLSRGAADPSKAANKLGWRAQIKVREVIQRLVEARMSAPGAI